MAITALDEDMVTFNLLGSTSSTLLKGWYSLTMLGGCDLCVQTLLLDQVQQQRQRPGDQALLVPS